MTPDDFGKWIEVLAKPSLSIVAIFALVFYREVIIKFFVALIEIAASWLKRKSL